MQDYFTQENGSIDDDDKEVEYFKLPVQLRIKKLEEGYITDPEVTLRRGTIRKNLHCEFDAVAICKRVNSASDINDMIIGDTKLVSQSKSIVNSDVVNLNTDVFDTGITTYNDYQIGTNIMPTVQTNVTTNSPDPEVHLRLPVVNNSCNTGTTTQTLHNTPQPYSEEVDNRSYEVTDVWTGFSNPTLFPVTAVQTPALSPFHCLAEDCNLHVGELSANATSKDTDARWKEYIKRYPKVSNTTTTVTATTTTASASMTTFTSYTDTSYSTVQQLQQQAQQQTLVHQGLPYSTTQHHHLYQTQPLQQPVLGMAAKGNVTNSNEGIYEMLKNISQQVAEGNRETAELHREVLGSNKFISTHCNFT